MQKQPIFFDCDEGRFQLVIALQRELDARHAHSCDLCDLHDSGGCRFILYGGECSDYDDLFPIYKPLRFVHWRRVLPTSKSAKTPRAERGTIGKEVH